MKATLLSKSGALPRHLRWVLILIIMIGFSGVGFSQQTLVNIGGWNAYVHLPDDYNTTGSKTYPVIFFFPGTGQVGTDASQLLVYGPGYFLASGWNGYVTDPGTGATIKPIIISLQPPSLWPSVSTVDGILTTALGMYRINMSQVTLTGLSMGGWVSEMYVMQFPTKIASVVAMTAVTPTDNPAYPTPFATYAQDCGHWLGYEQINDFRDMQTIANTMNAAVPNSAVYFQTNVGGGGHCCWNTWYDPTHTDSYSINGKSGNWNIYQFLVSYSGCSSSSASPPPTVGAGTAQTITLPTSTVTLTGTATGNGGATINSTTWTEVSGPGAATITTASALSTTVTGLVAGSYVFQLSATDNTNQTSTSTVTVTVNAALVAPTVSAGSAQTVTLPTSTATLTGTATGNGGATISSSTWTQVSGPNTATITTASALSTTVTGLVAGSYVFQLSATDNNNKTSTSTVTVTVNAAALVPPTVSAGSAQTITLPTSTATLTGTATGNGGATISSSTWTQVSGPNTATITTASALSTTVTGLVAGSYVFQLSATDNNNQTSTSTVTVTVNAAALVPPTVSAGSAQTVTLPTSTATLTGTATGNGGATISSSTWTQVSGPNTATITTASALSTTVTGLVAGSYVFQLSATDNNNQTSTSTVTVTVNAAALVPPTVSAGTAQTVTLPTSTATLTGTATGNGGATISSSTWTQVSGPNTATITTASALSTTVTGLVAGSYVFQLSATDNNNQTSTSTITVTVYAAGDCGCDFTLTPPAADGQLYLDGTSLGVKPGNKVCLKSAHYVSVFLYNFYGAPGNPITIVNCGGPVTISGYNSYGFILSHSWYVRVTGSGDPSTQYGIQIDGGPGATSYGYSENGHVRDIEVDHFEVKNIAGVGMGCAPTPSCDSTTWSVSWKMYNISFHDNYVHNTQGEGYYIGNTQYDYTYSCSFGNVDVHPQQIDSVKFYNNRIDSAGWTAAQISQVTGGVDIHDNLVTNYGWLNKPQHQAGFIVGEFSQGRVYRNKIIGGTGDAFQYFGNGVTTVYNNIFANAGWDGSAQGQPAVFVDDRVQATGYPALHLNFINNTIVNPARNGISFYNDNGTVDQGNIIANNIIVAPGIYATLPNVAYFDLQANPHATTSNNLTLPTIAPVLFLNAAGNDYHLLTGSPAIDAGMNAAPYGVTSDMDGNARPYGNAYDIGAYEFTNQPPPLIANAGGNQTIALPQNNIVLDASKSVDPAGTITSYTWKQLSGPNTAVIANASAVNTSAGSLQQGVYQFSITITDTRGLTASDTMTLTVNAAPPPTPPTANAGSPQTITLPNNSVTLNGSGSSDASGTITTYAWTEVSGPNTATIGSASGVSTTVGGLVQGTYVFQLKVTDNNGLSGTSTVSVTVNSAATPPSPPVANAGPAQSTTLPTDAVSLDGSASSDVSGTITGYAWTQVSGPGTASIGSPSGKSTIVAALVQGTYVFQLKVTDNNGLSGTATVTVTVYPAPMPPVANAGPAQTITLPTNSVTLSGSGSSTSGTITGYAWTMVSGPAGATIGSASSASTTVTNLVQGVYVFQLKVTDNTGQSGTATVTITVNTSTPPTPPTANAGAAQTITLPTNSATLNGSGSTDAGGSIVGYAWTQVSGPGTATIGSPSGVSTTVSGLLQGTYVFQLVVTDNHGLTSSATVSITVDAATVFQPPVANAGAAQTITIPTNSATLNGSGSTDADGSITGYAWTQVSGPGTATISSPSGVSTTVSGLLEGTYVFQLVVTDNHGLTGSATVSITVDAATVHQPPVANAGADQHLSSTSTSTNVSGAASYDLDGVIVQYSWKQISGAGGVTIANSTSVNATIFGLQPGTYVFQLTVTDNMNAGATATVTIYVSSGSSATSTPYAIAGSAITIPVTQTTAQLNGSSSYDVGGNLIAYSWTQVSGPGKAAIATASQANTSLNNLVAGDYVFELMVTDNNGNSATDTVSVTVVDNGRHDPNQLQVYPNPFVDMVNVVAVNSYIGEVKVIVYDGKGMLIQTMEYSKTSSTFSQQIQLSGLAKGNYLMVIQFAGANKPVTVKLVKQ